MRARRLLPPLALAVLVLSACGDADDTDEGPESGDEQPGELDEDELEDELADADELAEIPPPEVQLTDAGDDPRAPLRLTLEEGDQVDTRLTITSEQTAQGMQGPQAPISQTIDLTLTVAEVADGQATVDFEFTDAATEGLPEGQPDQSEQLVGLAGQMVLDERARVTAATQTAQGLDEVLIPFPEEEVGPGATWEVVTEATPEFPVGETLSVELVAFDGEQYELAVSVTSDDFGEPVEQEGMPGQEMTIRDIVISGEGEVAGSLSDLYPSAAALVNETTAVIDLGEEMGGEQTQHTRSEITLQQQ